jgi:hypothetical protein
MLTSEEAVFYRLLRFYESKSQVHIHSGHPPSGKTYIGALIRIPKRDKMGNATRDRYHVDYILQIGQVLVLQELKGSASESGGDVEKLRTLLNMYSLDEFRNLMAPRVHAPQVLSELRYVVPALGFEHSDAVLPADFLCIRAGEHDVKVTIGKHVDKTVADIISGVLNV